MTPLTFKIGEGLFPLKFTLNGFRAMQRETGVNPFSGEMLGNVDADLLAGFVLAGLYYAKPGMTLDEAGDLADQYPFGVLVAEVGNRMAEAQPSTDADKG